MANPIVQANVRKKLEEIGRSGEELTPLEARVITPLQDRLSGNREASFTHREAGQVEQCHNRTRPTSNADSVYEPDDGKLAEGGPGGPKPGTQGGPPPRGVSPPAPPPTPPGGTDDDEDDDDSGSGSD